MMLIKFQHEKGTARGARSLELKYGKQSTGFIQAEVVVSSRKDKAGKYDHAVAIKSLTMAHSREALVERDEAEDESLVLLVEKLFALAATAEQMALELQEEIS